MLFDSFAKETIISTIIYSLFASFIITILTTIFSEKVNKIKTINIDKVGAPVDVIPTIYNLFGIDYDSRLFAGNDLLSNSGGLAILGNRSWITNYGRYNSIDNIYTGEKDSDYVSNINNIVQNKIVFSKNIIDTDGYKYIREK